MRTEESYEWVDTRHSQEVWGKHRRVLAIPVYDSETTEHGGLAFRISSVTPDRLLKSTMHPLHQVWTKEKIREAATKLAQDLDQEALTEGVDVDLELELARRP